MESVVVERLGKRYALGKAKLFGKPAESACIWALRDVSFSLQSGERLGIIGHNGAGKTTLLRILGRITAPTEGRAVLGSRVFSLLEIGAGLQPDETGRENIRVHAAFYGLDRRDTEKLIGDVVSFAELEKFIDTPVRHYSSGMYLRLAFSLAVNMRPDVLLADEVLAVGDLGFQKRCLEKLQEVGRSGVTVLVVSHDMRMIRTLCSRCLWLDHGRVMRLGPAEEVVAEYESRTSSSKPGGREKVSAGGERSTSLRSGLFELVSAGLLSVSEEEIGVVQAREDFFIRIRTSVFMPGVRLGCVMDLYCGSVLVFRSGTPELRRLSEAGPYELWVKVPGGLLADREYDVHLHARADKDGDVSPLYWPSALRFKVYEAPIERVGEDWIKHNRHAVVSPRLEWRMEKPAAIKVEPEKS